MKHVECPICFHPSFVIADRFHCSNAECKNYDSNVPKSCKKKNGTGCSPSYYYYLSPGFTKKFEGVVDLRFNTEVNPLFDSKAITYQKKYQCRWADLPVSLGGLTAAAQDIVGGKYNALDGLPGWMQKIPVIKAPGAFYCMPCYDRCGVQYVESFQPRALYCMSSISCQQMCVLKAKLVDTLVRTVGGLKKLLANEVKKQILSDFSELAFAFGEGFTIESNRFRILTRPVKIDVLNSATSDSTEIRMVAYAKLACVNLYAPGAKCPTL